MNSSHTFQNSSKLVDSAYRILSLFFFVIVKVQKKKTINEFLSSKQLLIQPTKICIKNNNISVEGHELKLLNEFDNI